MREERKQEGGRSFYSFSFEVKVQVWERFKESLSCVERKKGTVQLRVSRGSLSSQPSLSFISDNLPWLHKVVINLLL